MTEQALVPYVNGYMEKQASEEERATTAYLSGYMQK